MMANKKLIIGCGANYGHEHSSNGWLTLDINNDVKPDICINVGGSTFTKHVLALPSVPDDGFNVIYTEYFPFNFYDVSLILKNISSIMNKKGILLCNNFSSACYDIFQKQFTGLIIPFSGIVICCNEFLSFQEILSILQSLKPEGFIPVSFLEEQLSELDRLSKNLHLESQEKQQLLCCYLLLRIYLGKNITQEDDMYDFLSNLSNLIYSFLELNKLGMNELTKKLYDHYNNPLMHKYIMDEGFSENSSYSAFYDSLAIIMQQFPEISDLYDKLTKEKQLSQNEKTPSNFRNKNCFFWTTLATGAALATAYTVNMLSQ